MRADDHPSLLWISQAFRVCISFIIVALLARSVTPEILGTYLAVTAVTLLMPRILDCGLPHALGYFLRIEPTALRSGLSLIVRHALLAAPAALLAAFSLRFVPFASPTVSPVLEHHWLQLTLLIVSELTVSLFLASYVPIGRFKAYMVTTLSPPLLFLTLYALSPRAALTPGRLIEYLLIASVTGLLIGILGLALQLKNRGRTKLRTASVYGYGLRSYGSAISKLAAQRFDRLFLVTVLGAAGYAQYSLAISIRDMAVLPANLFGMTLRNEQIDLIARHDRLPAARAMLRKTTMLWLLIGTLLAAAAYPAWPYIVEGAFGARFLPTAEFLRIVGFSCAPIAVMGFAWNHLYAMEQPGRVTLLTASSLLIAAPTFALLIRYCGPAIGAALAVLIWSALTASASIIWAFFARRKAVRYAAVL